MRLDQPRSVIDASGNMLNIVGEATLFACLDIVASKANRVDGLVLRGNSLDKEILLSRDQFMNWRLLHSGFLTQTIDLYVQHVLKSKIKSFKTYPELKVTEKKLNNTQPPVISYTTEEI